MVLSRESIEQMTEAELRKQVIIPLMESMGYQGIFEWHGGGGELGKDVVGWKSNDLGSRRNLAVVAKRGRISGVTSITTVIAQVAQAFNTPYRDPSTGEDEPIHQCWIAANGELKKEARDGIRAALPKDQCRDVEILDLNDTWKYVQQYGLVSIQRTLAKLKEQIGDSQHPFNIGVEIPGEGRPFASLETGQGRIILSEQYPGQLDKDPMIFNTIIEFPDTPEGREKLAEFQSAFGPGGGAQIPGEYFAIEFPKEIEQLMTTLIGAPLNDITMLSISPYQSNKRLPVRIDVECDDGDSESLEYVEWKTIAQNGNQMTLSNEDQAIPIQVTNIVDLVSTSSTISISLKEGSIAAPVLLHAARLVRCMAKPCTLKLWLIDPGLPLGNRYNDEAKSSPVDDMFVEMLEELTYVQAKLNVPIYVPKGEFSEQDVESLTLIHNLLRKRRFVSTWTGFNFRQYLPEAIDTARDLLSGDDQRKFRMEALADLQLFDSQIPLGTVVHIFEGAVIANRAEVNRLLEEGTEDADDFEFRLIPSDKNSRLTTTYLEWGDWADKDND